jgi:hypothetical protein
VRARRRREAATAGVDDGLRPSSRCWGHLRLWRHQRRGGCSPAEACGPLSRPHLGEGTRRRTAERECIGSSRMVLSRTTRKTETVARRST